MIVRDEEANLSHCLASVRGLFDEVVIVDTGSIDRTVGVARDFGSKVFDFPWCDDFSAARNESLRRAGGGYAFRLDADEWLEPYQRDKLRHQLDRLRLGDDAAYVFPTLSRHPGGAELAEFHVRLFPLRADLTWEHRVHEVIVPALKRAGVPIRRSDVVIQHAGYADPAAVARKNERNLAILMKEAAERPDDAHVLAILGRSALDRCDWDAAIRLFRRCSAASADPEVFAGLLCWIAWAQQQKGDLDAAIRTCEEGLKLFPDHQPLLCRKGTVCRLRGDSVAAVACWRRILELAPPDRFCVDDPGGMARTVALRNLGLMP